ncbi:hypothetical protein Emag_003302 [Eimeria magna]
MNGRGEHGKLQQMLTDYCVETCKYVESDVLFVCRNSVARYLPYTYFQEPGWHCYPSEALSRSGTFICVDDCGDEFHCGDAPGPYSMLSWGNSEVMEEMIRANRYRWCQFNTCTEKVQSLLDAYCKETLRFVCDPISSSCYGGAVARRDVGNNPAAGKAWRCYAPSALTKSVNTAECLQGCSPELVPCGDGVEGGVSSQHWDFQDALQRIISKTTANYVAQGSGSKLQQLLDDNCKTVLSGLCNHYSTSCLGGAKARKDGRSRGDKNASWHCYHPNSVRSDLYSSICLTNCGEEVPCGDGIDFSVPNALYDQYNVGGRIDALKKVTCVTTKPPETPASISNLQTRLDGYCRELLKDICQGEHCPSGAVARKEVGDSTQQQKQWRCYNSSQLTTSARTAICVTDCGAETSCGDGVIAGRSYSHWTKSDEIESLIEKYRDKNCRT